MPGGGELHGGRTHWVCTICPTSNSPTCVRTWLCAATAPGWVAVRYCLEQEGLERTLAYGAVLQRHGEPRKGDHLDAVLDVEVVEPRLRKLTPRGGVRLG